MEPPASESALSTAILVGMWNYMGWDNALHHSPGSGKSAAHYPRAMIASAVLVAVTYILPLVAIAVAGLSVTSFSTGDWMTAAIAMGGRCWVWRW